MLANSLSWFLHKGKGFIMVGVRGFETPSSWSQSKLTKRRRPLASFLRDPTKQEPDRSIALLTHMLSATV